MIIVLIILLNQHGDACKPQADAKEGNTHQAALFARFTQGLSVLRKLVKAHGSLPKVLGSNPTSPQRTSRAFFPRRWRFEMKLYPFFLFGGYILRAFALYEISGDVPVIGHGCIQNIRSIYFDGYGSGVRPDAGLARIN